MKTNSTRVLIEELLKESNDEFIEKHLKPFLSIPSYTLNQKGIENAKNFILNYISDFCVDIKEYKGIVNPLILAKVEGKTENTLLIYMMYDTQPITDRDKWASDPFGAETRVLSPPLDVLGNCIIARGAYNSKTPLMCFLHVIKILKENDSLPISLLLVFDGCEEIGSPTLLQFIENRKNLFEGINDAYYPSTKQDISGKAVIKLGYKGILSLTINIESDNKEPHSAFSGIIPNPVNDLISLLNKLYSENEFHIKSLKKPYILSQEEDLLIKDLVNVIDLEKIKKKAGLTNLLEDNRLDVLKNYLFKPTFNISTLKSGFLKDGIKNYVPNEATCNIDIRFAHNNSIEEIFDEITQIVEKYAINSKSKIELIRNIGYEGSRIHKESKIVKSLISCFKTLGISFEIWPISPAAAPLSKFKRDLGINFIVGGLGIGGFAHSPNEFIQVESILKAKFSYYHFLKNYSK